MNTEEAVYKYSTKHKEGFTQSEIDELLKGYPNINKEKFNNALFGITCMRKDGEIIIYHIDVAKALRCGIENRNLRYEEWD